MTLGSVITETIFISDPHAAHRSGSTSKIRRSSRAQLAREALGALGVLGRYRLLAVHRESRVDPAEQGVKELLREPLGAVQALEEASAASPRIASARRPSDEPNDVRSNSRSPSTSTSDPAKASTGGTARAPNRASASAASPCASTRAVAVDPGVPPPSSM